MKKQERFIEETATELLVCDDIEAMKAIKVLHIKRMTGAQIERVMQYMDEHGGQWPTKGM